MAEIIRKAVQIIQQASLFEIFNFFNSWLQLTIERVNLRSITRVGISGDCFLNSYKTRSSDRIVRPRSFFIVKQKRPSLRRRRMKARFILLLLLLLSSYITNLYDSVSSSSISRNEENTSRILISSFFSLERI